MNVVIDDFVATLRNFLAQEVPWTPPEVQFIPNPNNDRPHWDPATCRLMFCGRIVRKFAKRARNCIAVLNAFEEEGWPECIYDPLSGGKDAVRLNNSVRTLNRGTNVIRFRAGGDSASILWEKKK